MKEIEKKLRSIRAQYGRERQKTKKRKSGDGADDVYHSKWVHFERLKFLDEHLNPKNSQSNLQVHCMSTLDHLFLPCYSSI